MTENKLSETYRDAYGYLTALYGWLPAGSFLKKDLRFVKAMALTQHYWVV